MSPLHVAGAVVLFLALSGAAGVIGVKITSLGGQSGPKVIAAEKIPGVKAEREEDSARQGDSLTLFKHREYALDTYSHIFAKGNRGTNLKNLPGYQSEATKGGGLDLVAVEVTPFSFVNNGAVAEAKPIPMETLVESVTTAREVTKAKVKNNRFRSRSRRRRWSKLEKARPRLLYLLPRCRDTNPRIWPGSRKASG